VTESLTEHVEFLLKNGATYEMAPDLGGDVLDAVERFVARFIAFPNENAQHAHTLWVAHTYFMGCWGTTPRLLPLSPEPGSGKTALMEISQLLVSYGDDVQEDATPAYFYYHIRDSLLMGFRPTLFFDELDTVYGPHASGSKDAREMRRFIDGGSRSTGTRSIRLGKVNERFSIYAALALAGNMLPSDVPETIRTRSIIIPMQRAAADEMPEYWDPAVSTPLVLPYRDLLQYWAGIVHDHCMQHPAVDIPKGIRNRDRDCWQPLLRVAQLAGGRWPAVAAVAAVAGVAARGVNSEPSEGLWLLWEIKAIFDRLQADKIHTAALLHGLRATGRFRWTARPPQEAAIRLGQILDGYGVQSKDQRIPGINGGKGLKGYRREMFERAWSQYPPPSRDTRDSRDNRDGEDDE
jgi:Protein of unknown function (DUF3631)